MASGITAEIEGGQKLQKYLQGLAMRLGQGGEARVGFLEGRRYPTEEGGLTVAQVAFWNNFGTTRTPARPFFTNMVDDQASTWARKLGVAVRFSNYRAKMALEIVAADIKGHLVQSINLLEDPPLSPFTIAKKGFPKPLIDTAVMVNSPAWVVTTGAPKRD